ncbi:MAG: hypothetical protein K8R63_07445 [Bacteroidales bacterium]|nr:hypothetical protein [Bacteroidales bacterium]
MAKKKKTGPKGGKRFIRLHEVTDSGITASGRSRTKSIVGDRYTVFNTDKLKTKYKLVRAYELVRNFEVEEKKVIDIDFGKLLAGKVYMATKKPHPSFPSDESYMTKSNSSFLYPNGKILVIVIESIWNALKTKINRYVLDIANEGYWADIYTVRNATAKNIRALIKSKSPKGALLVGNVPAAFYKHDGSKFPCDLYYMDTNGTWHETSESCVFDSHTNNVNPEIWIGRLFTPTNDGNDTGLIKEYFDRNHQFRFGKMEHRRNALSFVDDDWAGYPKKIYKAWKGFPASFKSGVDAAIKWPYNNKVYFFKGDEYIRHDIDNGKIDPGYPKKISASWKGLPSSFHSNIDAAVAWPTNDKMYFFKGNKYIRYDASNNKMDPGYPKTIGSAWNGFPNSFKNGVDAAFTWPNGKIYFFKGDEYIRYDSATNKMDGGYPKRIRNAWCGFPKEFQQKVDTAAIFPNNIAYFFSGNMYVRYDIGNTCVDKAGFDDCAFDSMFPGNVIDVITHPNETRASVYKEELLKPRSWVQLCAHSGPSSHSFSADPPSGYVSNAYLRDTEPPKAYFYNLFCCSSGRFTTSQYIAGWYLFDKAGGGNCEGLAVIASAKSGSMLYFEDFYEPLGNGKDIGNAFKDWWIARGPSHDDGEIFWFYGMALLGDPTLTWLKGCVPIPTTPNDGEVLNHFPRELTFEWNPIKISGVKYDVEVDALGALVGGKWAAATNQVWDLRYSISGNKLLYTFVGAQRGRWRVRSRFGGNVSPWSKWQYFRFTI